MIGVTDPLAVSWRPVPLNNIQLKDSQSNPVGNIFLAHRWTKDGPGMIKPPPSKAGGRPPGTMIERSAKFKRGSEGEIVEAAATAIEAQNRALVQRRHLATQYTNEVSADEQT